MDDNLHKDSNDDRDDFPDVDKAGKALLKTANNLCLIGTRDITDDDVYVALFLVWQQRKRLHYHWQVYCEDIDVEQASLLLRDFDFATLQKTIEIAEHFFYDMYEYPPQKPDENKKTQWRMCTYDDGQLSSIVHLFQIEHNIKLDLRNGNCYRKRKRLKQIPGEVLIDIRTAIVARLKCELPPLFKSRN